MRTRLALVQNVIDIGKHRMIRAPTVWRGTNIVARGCKGIEGGRELHTRVRGSGHARDTANTSRNNIYRYRKRGTRAVFTDLYYIFLYRLDATVSGRVH